MKIIIPGTPIAKMRHRIAKNHAYDPQERLKKETKDFMRRAVNTVLEAEKTAIAYCVDYKFYFKPAKSLSKAKRLSKLTNVEPCLVRKDLDNLEKFYCDCANEILFNDDHQIVKMSSQKLWDEEERVEMIIEDYNV